MSALRPGLGDFSSIVCFKSVVVGMEEALGERTAAVALKAAGRKRGKQLVEKLGLTGAGGDLNTVAEQLNNAVGLNGTRLCVVDRIESENETIRVFTRETVCSAGEPQGAARECTFTLGAIHGALEAVTGRKLKGKQTGSVLRGQTHDIFEFESLI
jgi:predicted hydrocarbon binding protein